MLTVEKIDTWGFEHAIRGMRNPMNSWDKSDTKWCGDWDCDPKHECPYRTESGCDGSPGECVIGENDLSLMKTLYVAGTEHRKYLRQIFVSMDITAPLYWWKEFDTYKFVSPDPLHIEENSCSTMHKIHSKSIELSDFSFEDYYIEDMGVGVKDCFINVVADCERLRQIYLNTNDKKYWRALIQLLPESYNQKRTITMSYENIFNIIRQRINHKLDEWNKFIDVLKDLPYVKAIGGFENGNKA